jgi:hypothetical protein
VRYLEEGGWTAPAELAPEEARYFTIPGLFDTLRDGLQKTSRTAVQAEIAGNPPVPKIIFLGAVIQEGFPVEGTELRIEVLEYTPQE